MNVVPKATLEPDFFTFTGILENAQRIIQKCVADPRVDSGGFILELGMLRCVVFARGKFVNRLLVLESLSRRIAGRHPTPEIADLAKPAGCSI